MMGQLSSGQERMFYSFNLEDHIPANHLLRSIDQCLDLSDLRHHLADFYSPIGRPSIDPVKPGAIQIRELRLSV